MIDLAVVGQDPRFGGGAWALMEAFRAGAVALGREPELLYVEHPSLVDRAARPPLDVPGLRPPFRRLDPVNQLWGARHLVSPVRAARSAWVVATTAQYGAAAARAGRPYACWLAASLADEWRGQMPLLPRSRRLARRVNGPPLRRIERGVLRAADAVYGISPASADQLAVAAGMDRGRVRVLPLPVDVERFAPAPEDEYLRTLERPTLVYVGRGDDPRKNLPLLLDALPLVRSRIPEARVLLVGRPPRDLPPHVVAVGEVDDVAAELRRASLFVLPSRHEGFGIVAAEALAAGLPVVSTPSGGPEELLRASDGGRVVGGFDADELADAIVSLLADRSALLAARRAGRAYVEREHTPAALRARLGEAFAELDG